MKKLGWTRFDTNRLISMACAALCICGFVGLCIAPSEIDIVNVIACCCIIFVFIKEIGDLILNHVAEKRYYIALNEKSQQQKEEE